MGAFHSTKIFGLNFRIFRVPEGTKFSTWLSRSYQNGGLAVLDLYSITITSKHTFLILRSYNEIIIILRDIALDKIKKILFQELYERCRCVADTEMCHGNYSMSCETKEHTCGWWKGLTPPSLRTWRRRNGVEMPNETENFWIFQRLTEIFETSFRKIPLAFDFAPEFPEILVEWNAPNDSKCRDVAPFKRLGHQQCRNLWRCRKLPSDK